MALSEERRKKLEEEQRKAVQNNLRAAAEADAAYFDRIEAERAKNAKIDYGKAIQQARVEQANARNAYIENARQAAYDEARDDYITNLPEYRAQDRQAWRNAEAQRREIDNALKYYDTNAAERQATTDLGTAQRKRAYLQTSSPLREQSQKRYEEAVRRSGIQDSYIDQWTKGTRSATEYPEYNEEQAYEFGPYDYARHYREQVANTPVFDSVDWNEASKLGNERALYSDAIASTSQNENAARRRLEYEIPNMRTVMDYETQYGNNDDPTATASLYTPKTKNITEGEAYANTIVDIINNGYRLIQSTDSDVVAENARKQKVNYMTDVEKNTILNMARQGKTEELDRYIEALVPTINERSMNAYLSNLNNRSKVAMGAESLANPYIAPFAYAQIAADKIRGKYTDINSGAVRLTRQASALREKSLENAGDVGKFLGNAAYSTLDNLMLAPFGAQVSLGMMALGAAGGTAVETLESGGTEKQALIRGAVHGAIEYLTEKLPIENFFEVLRGSGSRGLKEFVKNWLSVALPEAGEELVSSFAGTLADVVIMGDESEYRTAIREAEAQGKTHDEAVRLANWKFLAVDPFNDALAGFLSGGALGGVGVTKAQIGQYISDYNTGSAITDKSSASGSFADVVLDEGMKSSDKRIASKAAALDAIRHENRRSEGFEWSKADQRAIGEIYDSLDADAKARVDTEAKVRQAERDADIEAETNARIDTATEAVDAAEAEEEAEDEGFDPTVPRSTQEAYRASLPAGDTTQADLDRYAQARQNARMTAEEYAELARQAEESYRTGALPPRQTRQLTGMTQEQLDARSPADRTQEALDMYQQNLRNQDAETERNRRVSESQPTETFEREAYRRNAVDAGFRYADEAEGQTAQQTQETQDNRAVAPVDKNQLTLQDAEKDAAKANAEEMDRLASAAETATKTGDTAAIDAVTKPKKKAAPRKTTTITKKSINAMKRILKDANMAMDRATYSGGKLYVTDGARLVRLNSDVADIDHAEKLQLATGRLDALIETTVRSDSTRVDVDESSVKSAIAAVKKSGNRKMSYELAPGYYVNPAYLQDMMNALPGADIYVPNSPSKPAYFLSGTGDGLLMPVRRTVSAIAGYNPSSVESPSGEVYNAAGTDTTQTEKTPETEAEPAAEKAVTPAEAAKVTANNARKVGLSSEDALVMSNVARDLGVKLAFQKMENGKVNGFYERESNTIVLNADLPTSEMAWTTFAHEITHAAESAGNYDQIRDIAKNYGVRNSKNVTADQAWRLAVAEMQSEYAKAGVKLSKKMAEFELIANTMQKILGSKTRIEGIVRESRAQAQALLQGVENVLDRVTENSTAVTPEAARLVKAQKALAAALNEVKGQKGGVQYSFAVNEDTIQNALAGNVDAVSRKTEQQYEDAVKRGDMDTAQYYVGKAALNAGAITKNGRMPLQLYHGTTRFGFTTFDLSHTKYDVGAIFTTTSESIASGYANFGRTRPISSRYIEDDGTNETLIKNAKNILNADIHPLTDAEAEDIRHRYIEQIQKMADAEAEAYNESDYVPPDDIFDAFWKTVQAFTTLNEEDPGLFYDDQEERESFRNHLSTITKTKYGDLISEVRDYYNNNDAELERLKSEGKPFYNLLYNNPEYFERLIDIDMVYKRLLQPEDSFVYAKPIFLRQVASLTTRDILMSDIEDRKNEGRYALYGFAGDKPLEIDAGNAYWTNIKAPMIGNGTYSTDSITKWAKENGYTSVIIKNVTDPGIVNDSGDDYIFFKESQVKSADPVTYDDKSKKIPLSERFNPEEQDIRYSMAGIDVDEIFRRAIEQYGKMQSGEQLVDEEGNPVTTQVDVPARSSAETKTRSLYRTAMEANSVTLNLRDRVVLDQYKPTSNEENVTKANEMRGKYKSFDRAFGAWQEMFEKGLSARSGVLSNQIAYAEVLLMEAQENGYTDEAYEIISDLAQLGTAYGQGVQALSLIKRLSPEGQLMHYQRVADTYKKNAEKSGKTGGNSAEAKRAVDIDNTLNQLEKKVGQLEELRKKGAKGSEVDGVLSEIESLQKKLRRVTGKKTSTQKKLADLVKQRDDLKKKLEERRDDLRKLKERRKRLLDNPKTGEPGALSRLKTQIETAQRDIDALEADLKPLNAEYDDLKKKRSEAYKERYKLQTEKKSIKERIDKAKTDIDNLKKEIDDLNEELDPRRARLNQLLADERLSRDRRNELKKELDSINSRIETKKNQIARHIADITEMMEEMSWREIELPELTKYRQVLKTSEQIMKEYLRYTRSKGGGVTVPDYLQRKFLSAKTNEERDAVRAEMDLVIADQLPGTWSEKIRAWRYTSMLLNPTTHIRNMAGNSVQYGLKGVRDTIATGLEHIFLREGEERTKAIAFRFAKGDKAYFDAADADFAKIQKDLQAGGKASEAEGIEKARKIFSNKVMEAIRRFSGDTLEAEDLIFLRANYTQSYAEYLKANKIDPSNITEEQNVRAREIAFQQALEATYRDASTIASTLNQLEKRGAGWEFAMGGIMPFKKTPVNILKRGIEYSPAGVIKATYDMIQMTRGKNARTKADIIGEYAAGITGTMLSLLGLFAAKAGVAFATPGEDDKDRKKAMDKATGQQDYAIKFNLFGREWTYTFDWLAPASMAFYAGARAYEAFRNNEKFTMQAAIDGLVSTINPVFELSMLDGLTSMFRSYASEQSSAAAQVGWSVLESLALQFFPTFGGKLARVIDPYQRSTYTSKDAVPTKNIQKLYRRIMAKIPGASYMLEPVTDQYGNLKENIGGNWIGRLAYNLLSPGYISPVTHYEADEEMKRLYKETGETGVLPKELPTSWDFNGETYYLDSTEYRKWGERQGKYVYGELEKLYATDEYKEANDIKKARMVKAVIDAGTEYAKLGFFEDIGLIDDYYRKEIDSILYDDKDGERTNKNIPSVTALYEENRLDLKTVYEAVESLKSVEGGMGPKTQALDNMIGNLTQDEYNFLYMTKIMTDKDKRADVQAAVDAGATLTQAVNIVCRNYWYDEEAVNKETGEKGVWKKINEGAQAANIASSEMPDAVKEQFYLDSVVAKDDVEKRQAAINDYYDRGLSINDFLISRTANYDDATGKSHENNLGDYNDLLTLNITDKAKEAYVVNFMTNSENREKTQAEIDAYKRDGCSFNDYLTVHAALYDSKGNAIIKTADRALAIRDMRASDKVKTVAYYTTVTDAKSAKENITTFCQGGNTVNQFLMAVAATSKDGIKQYQKAEAIMQMDLISYTAAMKSVVTGSENAAKAIDGCLALGIKDKLVARAYAEYSRINADESTYGNEKAVEFAKWVDRDSSTQSLSKEQRDYMIDNFSFYIQLKASAGQYNTLMSFEGMSSKGAESISKSISALEPLPGAKGISAAQKYTAVANAKGATDREKDIAMYNLLDSDDDEADNKALKYYKEARKQGVTIAQYADFRTKNATLTADKDKNGKSISGSKRNKQLALINSYPISAAAKDALYRAAGLGESTLKKAPWH